jgi:hypothetical protein
MKIVSLMAFLLFMNLPVAFCPNIKTFNIPRYSPTIETPISTLNYMPLVKAVFYWETRGNLDTLSYNAKEQAYGGLQIRECRLRHFNKLTGKSYTLNDMYDFNKATEVFIYFATHNNHGKLIKSKSYEQVAKNWNGSGKMTETYWEAVKPLIKT